MAVRLLARLDGTEAIPDLVNMLQESGDSGSICAVIDELAHFGKRAVAAVTPLERMRDAGPSWQFPPSVAAAIRKRADRAICAIVTDRGTPA